MTVKRCSHCRERKPLEEFSRRSDQADGRSYTCRACISEMDRRRRKNIGRTPRGTRRRTVCRCSGATCSTCRWCEDGPYCGVRRRPPAEQWQTEGCPLWDPIDEPPLSIDDFGGCTTSAIAEFGEMDSDAVSGSVALDRQLAAKMHELGIAVSPHQWNEKSGRHLGDPTIPPRGAE